MEQESALNSDASKYIYVFTDMSKIKCQNTCKSKLTIFFHTQNNNLFDLELSENMEPLLSSMQNLSFRTTSFKRIWWNSITDYGRVLELTLLETQHIGLPSCMLFGQTNIIKCYQYHIGIWYQKLELNQTKHFGINDVPCGP
jgi:hypothetical protein